MRFSVSTGWAYREMCLPDLPGEYTVYDFECFITRVEEWRSHYLDTELRLLNPGPGLSRDHAHLGWISFPYHSGSLPRETPIQAECPSPACRGCAHVYPPGSECHRVITELDDLLHELLHPIFNGEDCAGSPDRRSPRNRWVKRRTSAERANALYDQRRPLCWPMLSVMLRSWLVAYMTRSPVDSDDPSLKCSGLDSDSVLHFALSLQFVCNYEMAEKHLEVGICPHLQKTETLEAFHYSSEVERRIMRRFVAGLPSESCRSYLKHLRPASITAAVSAALEFIRSRSVAPAIRNRVPSDLFPMPTTTGKRKPDELPTDDFENSASSSVHAC